MELTEAKQRPRASIAAVLDFAWDAGVFRADHAIAALGLTRSTTLTALDALIDLGLVRELPAAGAEEGYRMGRPARRFELNADAGVVVGVDAGAHAFRATAADLTGRGIASVDAPVPPAPDPAQGRAQRRASALQAIDAALTAAGRTRRDVVAVCAGIPAPVDAEASSPAHPSDFWATMNADLQAALAEVFPAARLENDAALAAVAERSRGEAVGADNFVAMLVGRRLGSGVFLDGHLVRGGHGAVGELGFLSHLPGVGSTEGIGARTVGWAQVAIRAGAVPEDHPWAAFDADDLRAEQLLAAARPDDPVTAPMLHELGETLGRVCTLLARIYDPTTIVVCGAVSGALTDVLDIARARLSHESTLPAPRLVASRFGADIVSLGAVAAAVEAARPVALPFISARRRG